MPHQSMCHTRRPISPPTGHFQIYSISRESEDLKSSFDILTTRHDFQLNLKYSGGMNGDKPEVNLSSEERSGRESRIQREGNATVDLWRCDDGGRVTEGETGTTVVVVVNVTWTAVEWCDVCVSWDGVSDTMRQSLDHWILRGPGNIILLNLNRNVH